MGRFGYFHKNSVTLLAPAKSMPNITDVDGFRQKLPAPPPPTSYDNEGDVPSSSGSSSVGSSSVMDGTVRLTVVLPSGLHVPAEVDAQTSMMDVLVQVAAENGFNPGGMALKVPTTSPSIADQYKPSTPIGKISSDLVQVVSKCELEASYNRARRAQRNDGKLPFELTQRIQIELARGRRTFVRISPDVSLGDLLAKVAHENPTVVGDVRRVDIRCAELPAVPLELCQSIRQTGTTSFVLVKRSDVVASNRLDNNKHIVCRDLRSHSSGDIPKLMAKANSEEKGKQKKRGGLLCLLPGYSKRKSRSKAPQPPSELLPSSSTADDTETVVVSGSSGGGSSNVQEKSSDVIASTEVIVNQQPLRSKAFSSPPPVVAAVAAAAAAEDRSTRHSSIGHQEPLSSSPPPKPERKTKRAAPKAPSVEIAEITVTQQSSPTPRETTAEHQKELSLSDESSSGFHDGSAVSSSTSAAGHSPGGDSLIDKPIAVEEGVTDRRTTVTSVKKTRAPSRPDEVAEPPTFQADSVEVPEAGKAPKTIIKETERVSVVVRRPTTTTEDDSGSDSDDEVSEDKADSNERALPPSCIRQEIGGEKLTMADDHTLGSPPALFRVEMEEDQTKQEPNFVTAEQTITIVERRHHHNEPPIEFPHADRNPSIKVLSEHATETKPDLLRSMSSEDDPCLTIYQPRKASITPTPRFQGSLSFEDDEAQIDYIHDNIKFNTHQETLTEEAEPSSPTDTLSSTPRQHEPFKTTLEEKPTGNEVSLNTVEVGSNNTMGEVISNIKLVDTKASLGKMQVSSFEEEYLRQTDGDDFMTKVRRGVKSKIDDTLSLRRPSAADRAAMLQNEYLKLQQLFDDWQESVQRNDMYQLKGQKMTLAEAEVFTKVQHELINQHRVVQRLCSVEAPVQTGRTLSSHLDSTGTGVTVPTDNRLGSLDVGDDTIIRSEQQSSTPISVQLLRSIGQAKALDKARNDQKPEMVDKCIGISEVIHKEYKNVPNLADLKVEMMEKKIQTVTNNDSLPKCQPHTPVPTQVVSAATSSQQSNSNQLVKSENNPSCTPPIGRLPFATMFEKNMNAIKKADNGVVVRAEPTTVIEPEKKTNCVSILTGQPKSLLTGNRKPLTLPATDDSSGSSSPFGVTLRRVGDVRKYNSEQQSEKTQQQPQKLPTLNSAINSSITATALTKSAVSSQKTVVNGNFTAPPPQQPNKPPTLNSANNSSITEIPSTKSTVSFQRTVVNGSTTAPPPPPPPPPPLLTPDELVNQMRTVKLKPVGQRVGSRATLPKQQTDSGDVRGDLMAQIRNFGGGDKLKRKTNSSD